MTVWGEPPTLAGRHVTLRPVAPDDLPALVAAASADGLWDIFYASVTQLKDADSWLARATVEQAGGRSLVFAVLDAAGTVCGTTRFMRMNPAHRRLEIGGTFYATRVQRTGVNTEAKRLLLGHAFETLGCQCVQIRTDSLNRRSQAAIERRDARRGCCAGIRSSTGGFATRSSIRSSTANGRGCGATSISCWRGTHDPGH